jgi:glyoxylase-like metal-dependent hydrolase (beta-lactamase superfamily II)
MNGQPYSTYTANEVRFNPTLNDADFAIPEGDRKASLAMARDLEEIPIGIPSENPKEIASGIVYINGPGAFHSTEVRQSDGIVIVEAVISSGYSARIIEDAQKRFPGLPIKALLTTSDSWPHIGGVREYAARGIPIYALDLNRPILTRLLAAPHTLHPDLLARNPREAKFTFVSERSALGTGENRIEIIPFRTVTGERQMMVYLPGAKLVYTSDLFAIGGDGSLFLPQFAREAEDAISRERLDVERVYGMHYDPVPLQQLHDAIETFLKSSSKQ